ncbi:hypothetical protein IAR50_006494 [Cryptococcus sp. DSM 104548]
MSSYPYPVHVYPTSYYAPFQTFLPYQDVAYEEAFDEEIKGILWRMNSSKGSDEALSNLPLPKTVAVSSFQCSPLLSHRPTFTQTQPSPSQLTSDMSDISAEVEAFLDIIEDDDSPTQYWGTLETGFALPTLSQQFMPRLMSSSSRAAAMPTFTRRHSSAHVNPTSDFGHVPTPSFHTKSHLSAPQTATRTIYNSAPANFEEDDRHIPKSRRFSAPDISHDTPWASPEKPIKKGQLKEMKLVQQEKQVMKDRKRIKWMEAAALVAAEQERVKVERFLDVVSGPQEKQGFGQKKDRAPLARKRIVDPKHAAVPEIDTTLKPRPVKDIRSKQADVDKKAGSNSGQRVKAKSLSSKRAPSPSPSLSPVPMTLPSRSSSSTRKKRQHPKSVESESEDDSQPTLKKAKHEGKKSAPVRDMLRYSDEEDQMILKLWDGRRPLSLDTLTRMQSSMAMKGLPPRSISALKYRAHHVLKPKFDEKRLALAAKRGRR